MKAVILAGGLGTRLRAAVPDLPKCLAEVAGKPFLEHLFMPLQRGGVTEVVLAVGYRADAIVSRFGEHWGRMQLRYSFEQTPLGTGGAMARALALIEDSHALVLNGDTFLDIDYTALEVWHRQSPADVAVVLRHVPDTARFGAVQMVDGRIGRFLEKGRSGPGYINAGTYVVARDAFAGSGLPEAFSFESDYLQPGCGRLQPPAYVCDGFFIDIGTPEDYARAQTLLAKDQAGGKAAGDSHPGGA